MPVPHFKPHTTPTSSMTISRWSAVSLVYSNGLTIAEKRRKTQYEDQTNRYKPAELEFLQASDKRHQPVDNLAISPVHVQPAGY